MHLYGLLHSQGKNYLVIVDRYSNWPIIERAANGALGFIESLRHTFATYGIPDELASIHYNNDNNAYCSAVNDQMFKTSEPNIV